MKKILLVLSAPPENEALVARLLEIADQSTSVMVLTIVHEANLDGYLGNSDIYEPLRKRLLEEQADKAEPIVLRLKQAGIDVESKTVWDWPRGDAIRREAFACGADAIVLSFGLDKNRHLGSREWRFLAECPLPILVVNRPAGKAYADLVAAVDPVHAHAKPAELDSAIVQLSSVLRTRTGADLHLVHCFVPLAHFGASASETVRVPLNDAEQALEKSRRNALDRLASEIGLDTEAALMIEGDPVKGLERAVEDIGADLVVMGALSRGKLAELIIGSTAERLLRWGGCDVFVVKPPGSTN